METTKKLLTEMTKLQDKLKNSVKDELVAYMKENPELKAIRWQQYAPYFNDGDACVFSVHGVYVHTEDMTDDEGDHGDGFEYISTYGDSKTKKYKELEEVLTDSNIENVLQGAFGDSVEVTVSQDGKFEVEEYDHD